MQAAEADGETNGTAVHPAARRKRAWEDDSDEDAVAEHEAKEAEEAAAAEAAAREEDLRQRAEFEERLRARDEARTRKIAEAKLTPEELAVRAASSQLFKPVHPLGHRGGGGGGRGKQW